MKKLRKAKRNALKAIGGALQSALSWLFIFALVGAGSIVSGIGLLFGVGWACIAFGLCLFAAAWVLRLGMIANG